MSIGSQRSDKTVEVSVIANQKLAGATQVMRKVNVSGQKSAIASKNVKVPDLIDLCQSDEEEANSESSVVIIQSDLVSNNGEVDSEKSNRSNDEIASRPGSTVVKRHCHDNFQSSAEFELVFSDKIQSIEKVDSEISRSPATKKRRHDNLESFPEEMQLIEKVDSENSRSPAIKKRRHDNLESFPEEMQLIEKVESDSSENSDYEEMELVESDSSENSDYEEMQFIEKCESDSSEDSDYEEMQFIEKVESDSSEDSDYEEMQLAIRGERETRRRDLNIQLANFKLDPPPFVGQYWPKKSIAKCRDCKEKKVIQSAGRCSTCEKWYLNLRKEYFYVTGQLTRPKCISCKEEKKIHALKMCDNCYRRDLRKRRENEEESDSFSN